MAGFPAPPTCLLQDNYNQTLRSGCDARHGLEPLGASLSLSANGYPNTDVCGLLGSNENMCRLQAGGSQGVRRARFKPPLCQLQVCCPPRRPGFPRLWNGEDASWPPGPQSSFRDPGVNRWTVSTVAAHYRHPRSFQNHPKPRTHLHQLHQDWAGGAGTQACVS